MAQLKLSKPIIFFDLETTGVNIAKDRIVEISLIKVMADGSEERVTERINPEQKIPKEVSAVHGIFDADVADKPKFKERAQFFFDFIGDCDLGGYNCHRFDVPLIKEEFLRAGLNLDFNKRRVVDVQRIFHKMEARTLTAAYKFYCQKDLTDAHSAEADTFATYEVLKAQIDKYDNLQNDIAFLHDFSAEDHRFIDSGRRFVDKKGVACFNFGKHKGKPVTEVLLNEPGYYDWMQKNDFGLDTKQKLKEIKQAMLLQNKFNR